MLFVATLPSYASAQAAWPPGGVQVCPLGASFFRVAEAPDGGVFVLWGGITLSNFITRPFLQKILPSGVIAPGWPGSGLQIGRDSIGTRDMYAVSDGAGGAYIAWADFPGSDVYLQRISAHGTVSPGWPPYGLLLCGQVAYQDRPRLVADADGVFVVWQDHRAFDLLGSDIYGIRVLANGTIAPGWPQDGLPLCTAPGEQSLPFAVSDGAGGAFVSWALDRRSASAGFHVLRVGSDGLLPGWLPDGNEYSPGSSGQQIGSIIGDGSGGLYVSWSDCPSCDIYLQRINSDGGISPGWPAYGVPVTTAPGVQSSSRTALDGIGGVFVAWNNGGDIYAQRLQGSGALAPSWPVNGRFVGGDFGAGHVAADGRGGAYFAYEKRVGSHDEVHVQHLDGFSGVMPGWEGGLPVLAGAIQSSPAIVSDGSGGAIVVWIDDRVINNRAIYAQRYVFDGPTPTLISLVSAEAHPDHVSLAWHRAGDAHGATVYRRTDAIGWLPLGEASDDASGVIRYDDRSVTPEQRYAYRLGIRDNGGEMFSDETWVDVPAALQFALGGLRPNPASGPLRVSLTLPRPGRAALELIDVSGRAVIQREVGSLGPGQHLFTIGDARDFSPGIYWLRLTTDERTFISRAAVVR